MSTSQSASRAEPGMGQQAVGRRLRIMWNDPPKWFAGTVVEFDATGLHLVKYDDGDQKRHNLAEEIRIGQLAWEAPWSSGVGSTSSRGDSGSSKTIGSITGKAAGGDRGRHSSGAVDAGRQGRTLSRQQSAVTTSTPAACNISAAAGEDTVDDAAIREEARCAQLGVGGQLFARDRIGVWCKARVVALRAARTEGSLPPNEVKVHFLGWNSRHDEWISVGAGRLRLEKPVEPQVQAVQQQQHPNAGDSSGEDDVEDVEDNEADSGRMPSSDVAATELEVEAEAREGKSTYSVVIPPMPSESQSRVSCQACTGTIEGIVSRGRRPRWWHDGYCSEGCWNAQKEATRQQAPRAPASRQGTSARQVQRPTRLDPSHVIARLSSQSRSAAGSNDTVHEIERIVEERQRPTPFHYKGSGTVEEFRIRWKGFGPEHDTWEPLKHIFNGAQLVAKFREDRAAVAKAIEAFETAHQAQLVRVAPPPLVCFREDPPDYFVCTFEGCGQRFTELSKLQRHRLKHTGEQRYVCPFPGCDHRCSLEGHMKSHIVAHQAGQALLRAEIGGTLRQKWQNLAMPGGGGMGSMGGMDGMGGGHSARISIEAIRTQAKSHYLLVLAHATKCQSADCTVPECALTKTLLANHTRSCRAGEACTYPRCALAKALMLHHLKCQDQTCAICLPLRRRMAATKSFPPPGSLPPLDSPMPCPLAPFKASLFTAPWSTTPASAPMAPVLPPTTSHHNELVAKVKDLTHHSSKRHITRDAIARRIGVSGSHFSCWLNGKLSGTSGGSMDAMVAAYLTGNEHEAEDVTSDAVYPSPSAETDDVLPPESEVLAAHTAMPAADVVGGSGDQDGNDCGGETMDTRSQSTPDSNVGGLVVGGLVGDTVIDVDKSADAGHADAGHGVDSGGGDNGGTCNSPHVSNCLDQARSLSRKRNDLPPGWTTVRHEAPAGPYFVYHGPDGEKLRSKARAWQLYDAPRNSPTCGDDVSGCDRSGGAATAATLVMQAASANETRALPPGWTVLVHDVPSGAYKSYVGPQGQREKTIKGAWLASGLKRCVGMATQSTADALSDRGDDPSTALTLHPEPAQEEWVDGVPLIRSGASATGYRGVYAQRNKEGKVVHFIAKGPEGVPAHWDQSTIGFRRESRNLGVFPTVLEAATAVAKHAVSLDAFLEWAWRRSDERSARREREREQKRELDAQKSEEREAKRRKLDELRAARKAEAEAKAEARMERLAARQALMASVLRAKVPRVLCRLRSRDMDFRQLSRFDRSVLVRARGGTAKVAPTKADDENLAREWEEVSPSSAILELMCAKAAERMEVEGEGKTEGGDEQEEEDADEAWEDLEVGENECEMAHLTYRELVGSDVCVLEAAFAGWGYRLKRPKTVGWRGQVTNARGGSRSAEVEVFGSWFRLSDKSAIRPIRQIREEDEEEEEEEQAEEEEEEELAGGEQERGSTAGLDCECNEEDAAYEEEQEFDEEAVFMEAEAGVENPAEEDQRACKAATEAVPPAPTDTVATPDALSCNETAEASREADSAAGSSLAALNALIAPAAASGISNVARVAVPCDFDPTSTTALRFIHHGITLELPVSDTPGVTFHPGRVYQITLTSDSLAKVKMGREEALAAYHHATNACLAERMSSNLHGSANSVSVTAATSLASATSPSASSKSSPNAQAYAEALNAHSKACKAYTNLLSASSSSSLAPYLQQTFATDSSGVPHSLLLLRHRDLVEAYDTLKKAHHLASLEHNQAKVVSAMCPSVSLHPQPVLTRCRSSTQMRTPPFLSCCS